MFDLYLLRKLYADFKFNDESLDHHWCWHGVRPLSFTSYIMYYDRIMEDYTIMKQDLRRDKMRYGNDQDF